MTDLSTLAASLSEAQRRALTGAISASGPSGDLWLSADCDEEIARRLFLDDCVTLRLRLTPLGMQVRDHLERNG